MSIIVYKAFRISDDFSYFYQLEGDPIDGVTLSYWESDNDDSYRKTDTINFPSEYAPIIGKLLLEQFTIED